MASSSHQNGIKKPKIEIGNNRILMDDVTDGKEFQPIPVINNVNNNLPKQFGYIHFNNLSTEARRLSKSFDSEGCHCTDGCNSDCECENSSTISFDRHLRIVSNPESYNFYTDFYVECGIQCHCKGKCKRQIILEHNVMKKVEVHWLHEKKFGILAGQPIAAGMPITEYVGEVFVAGVEDNIYPLSHYQQLLLYDNEHNKFVIDARRMGNIARFINHSCFSNVLTICVYPSIPNLNRSSPLPKVVLIAFRDILPGQEICFDYGPTYFLDRGVPCFCYELNCNVPPADYMEKARSEKDVCKEISQNKRKMRHLFDQAGDVERRVVEIDD